MRNSLKPSAGAKSWWALMIAVSVVLALPLVINAAIPERLSVGAQPVVLSGTDNNWEIPVYLDPEQQQQQPSCMHDGADPLVTAFACPGGRITSTVVESTDDPVLALQRMVRAIRVTGLPTDEAVFSLAVDSEDVSDAYVIASDRGYVAVSGVGAGEHEGTTMVALVSGENAPEIGAAVFASLTGEEPVALAERGEVVYGESFLDGEYPLAPRVHPEQLQRQLDGEAGPAAPRSEKAPAEETVQALNRDKDVA
ncbi:hypothetical protein [Corynebacterium sp. TAE3-ERU2]|uniref:hypothetical protein n=1 Tax=Corynebacterium sp. TAE3-ERU2 TaxID=2849497 RepID=UPI001C476D2C|nr:hypothetical protein [Corynebacterium sp. TAE3-ERU2]MBV7302383.1 hypothetical protein [Corynebacterium sp. TAE3-ERU2]